MGGSSVRHAMFWVIFGLSITLAFFAGLSAVRESKRMEQVSETVKATVTKIDVFSEQGFNKENGDTGKRATYVLGGTQHGLRSKYGRAAFLLHQGTVEKVFVLSSPGITEFARDLGRNLTNDEWTVRQLTRLGVEEERIEFIALEDGFFGTLKEAKTLKAISGERGIERLVLVCSAYHSRRVWVTFSALFGDLGVEIEIHTAEEKVGVGGVLVEYAKLLFYKYVLIPYEGWSQKREGMALSHLAVGFGASPQRNHQTGFTPVE